MSKLYEKCKERNEYHYWNHTDDQHKHFFKVMIGDFRERMTIPDKFAQHFRGELTTIKLESCNGCTFDVQVTKNLDKVVFQSGWKAFVSAHDLKMGDFLVFKYGRISQLKVLIFDPSGCEKSSLCAMKNASHVRQRWEEPIDISSSCHDRPAKSPQSERKPKAHKDRLSQGNKIIVISSSSTPSEMSSSCHDLPAKSPQSERKPKAHKDRLSRGNKIIDISSSSTPSEMSGYNSKCQTISTECKFRHHVISSDDDVEAHFVPSCILPRGTRLTEVQEKKMEEKVQAIHSHVAPIYGCIMTKCNVFGRPCLLDLSRKYADAYLPHKEQTLMLNRHDKSWKVRFCINKNNSKRFYQGWRKFAHDNNLQIGDLCLFELLKRKKYVVNIHIIRRR